MAEYRTVRMSFWHDPFIEELDAKGKLLYLYLFTSPYTNNFGIVEVTRKKMAYETGLSIQDIEKYLSELEDGKKLITDGGWVWLVNFIKNQTRTSPRIIDGLKKDAPTVVPSKKLAESICSRYPQVYDIDPIEGDTYTIPTPLGAHTFTYTCPEFGSWKIEDGKGKGRGDQGPPDCPHDKIREIYHEALPELPRAVTWGPDRQDLLRTRWRETWERLRKKGEPHDIQDLLAWWVAYFARVRASPFLVGQVVDKDGKAFFADLEWLVRPTNYAKVLDGKYLNRQPNMRAA